MTITQKILAAHAGVNKVEAGELIMVRTDLVLGNDITSPVAINEFEKYGFNKVFDKEKIALVMDHFAPNKDIKAAEQCKQCRDFANKHELKLEYKYQEDLNKPEGTIIKQSRAKDSVVTPGATLVITVTTKPEESTDDGVVVEE